MADEKQKLVAEISGDAKPMQQALDAAKKSVEQTAKAVQQTSQQTRQGYDRAAQAANKMGQTGASANMTVAQAMRHPIQTVKTLAIEAKNAAAALLGIGRAGRQASAESKELGGALGQMVGMGSKMAIIAKGFQALGNIIKEAVIAPIRDAYKETERLANLRLNANAGLFEGKAGTAKENIKALQDYYAAFEKASKAGATEQDRLAERMARSGLENRNVDIDPTAYTPVEKQVRDQIESEQKKYISALEGKEKEMLAALDAAQKAYEQVENKASLFGDTGAFESELFRLQDVINQRRNAAQAIRAEIKNAEKQTPGEDFSRKVAAQAADRLAEEYDKQAKAMEEAGRKEEEARRRLAEAEERRADIERQLADEGRLEAMQHTRDLLNHQMGRFGFRLDEYDEENLAETNMERVRRRRNVRLDARIESKLERQRQGYNVHFSPREQRRIEELRALKAQGEGLTAEEKAMQAARKQEDAAKRLDEAAKAIENAAREMEDANVERGVAQSRGESIDWIRKSIANENDFYAMTKTRGSSAVPDYGSILEQIRGLLDAQSDRIYVVK